MNKIIKKSLSFIFVFTLVISLFSGCSSKLNADMTEENITATVDTAFNALVNFDTDTLKTYVSSSTLSSIMTYAKKYSQIDDLAKAMFANLTYEIEDINIDASTVTLTVYNKDLYDPAYEFVNELLEKYNTLQLLANLTDSSWRDSNLSKLTEEIDDSPLDTMGNDITLTINQKTNNLVLYFDTEAEDAVSGGALGAITQLF